jgi:hypothetical protein
MANTADLHAIRNTPPSRFGTMYEITCGSIKPLLAHTAREMRQKVAAMKTARKELVRLSNYNTVDLPIYVITYRVDKAATSKVVIQ